MTPLAALPRLFLAVCLAGTLAACSATTRTDVKPDATPTSATTSSAVLGAGFYDPSHPPAPEGTITPSPGSWDKVVPPRGYTAVLIGSGDDAITRALAAGVRSWAKAEGVRLTTVPQRSHTERIDTDHIDTVYAAIARHPDVVISVGNAMIDPVAAVSPSHLKQQFLVVGGELAEPTDNVTAADWEGATFKGEGLGQPAGYDPKSFTAERIGRALRAGIAAVLAGVTGIVVRVD